MIYLDLNIEPIDQVDDIWWVFYLPTVCTAQEFDRLLASFAERGAQVIARQDNDAIDPDLFQAVLYDTTYDIWFTLYNSATMPRLFLGTRTAYVIPPNTARARLSADYLIECGKICYDILAPIYGFVGNLNDYVEPDDVSAYRLTCIFWSQLYSPAFVQSVGREIITTAPGWRNENLRDGGLLYVLSESPYCYSGRKQLWDEARFHFERSFPSGLQWSGDK